MEGKAAREVIVSELVSSCPIQAIRKTKPCPFFGPSLDCDTCMYPWESIAHELIETTRLLLKKEKEERLKRKAEKAKAERKPL